METTKETKILNIIKETAEKKAVPPTLLSTGISNAKTAKNSLDTFILYLAPYNQNSKKINICPKASKGCAAACLFTAGRGIMRPVLEARIAKTEYYLRDKKSFVMQLAKEIYTKYKTARRQKNKIAFRLNGTSDIDFIYLLKKYAQLDISMLADWAVFYDYTKILGKVKKYKGHPNYFLTFSRAENNNWETLEALRLGASVSVVFRDKFPKSWYGYPVLDGDASDIVMIYNRGVVLGLKAKGDAKKDTTGFVVG